ncbi:MAG: DUF5677 domain-containing protein [Nitrobacter sp.]
MDQSPKLQKAIAFSEKLLGIAIDTVGSANVQLSKLGARDPKIVSLALLCRTISNFKGAVTMAREGLVIEARTLTRCCYENLIWAAALNERGYEFVTDMLNDDAASRKTVGQITLKLTSRAGGDSEAGDAKLLRDLIRESDLRFPARKKLRVDETAVGSAVELVYATFGHLSLEAAYPTVTALGRHLLSEIEGDTRHLVVQVVPEVPEGDLVRTIWWSCEALLGVTVASNEIVGGIQMSESIRQAMDELHLERPTVKASNQSREGRDGDDK